MNILELANKLKEVYDRHGDVEVLVTDGFRCRCYRGDYSVIEWGEDDGTMCVDIGIGGCDE